MHRRGLLGVGWGCAARDMRPILTHVAPSWHTLQPTAFVRCDCICLPGAGRLRSCGPRAAMMREGNLRGMTYPGRARWAPHVRTVWRAACSMPQPALLDLAGTPALACRDRKGAPRLGFVCAAKRFPLINHFSD